MTQARLDERPVVLRYFPAVGRAQALRHALTDSGVEFEDVRIPMSEWPKVKENVSLAGPYRGLPTLQCGSSTLAETLPIATFLARRLGQYDGMSDARMAELDAQSSVAYLDIVRPAAEAIWADLIYPGMDQAASYPRMLSRTLEKASHVEAALPEQGWFGGDDPTLADFFVAEAVEALRYVLGPTRDERFTARLPRLTSFAARVRTRPTLATAWQKRPDRFTGRPDEPAALDRLRAIDLSALRL
jgi:glutathione S-transferase